VFVFLGGGIDAVCTTDPKLRVDVESGIDVPYGAADIVEAGPLLLGPHLRPLARWAPRLAIVNGVQVRTANHPTGAMQLLRMRTGVSRHIPSLAEILGVYRDEQPLSAIALGTLTERDYSPGWFGVPLRAGPDQRGPTLLDELEDATPADLERLASGLRRQAKRLVEGADARRAEAAAHYEQVAALCARLPDARPFQEVPWPGVWPEMALALQRALWVVENDLARCVFVELSTNGWDTHYDNLFRQAAITRSFAVGFDRFLGELGARSGPQGPLSASTLVAAGSELGRFPRLNGEGGKDHLPEAPFLLIGPGIRPGSYGRTGRRMEALPVALDTGDLAPRGGHLLVLDDLGATLLAIAGIDPASHGYGGRILTFLGG
jgi:hypothetical protein